MSPSEEFMRNCPLCLGPCKQQRLVVKAIRLTASGEEAGYLDQLGRFVPKTAARAIAWSTVAHIHQAFKAQP